jgi:CcmD family protein
MMLLVIVYSIVAIGIIAYTFRLGGKQEETDRRIEALRQRIRSDREP